MTVGERLKAGRRGVGLAAAVVLIGGCHAQQVTEQFSVGFDQAIGRLYETHVLNNLARCDNDEFFVQMTFGNFGSDITRTGSLSAQVTLWGNRANTAEDNQDLVIGLFEQSYSPTISHSQSARLGFTASPAPAQSAILALYQAEVERPPEERFFCVTRSFTERMGAYCATRRGVDTWYIVPRDRQREFCAFVHRVSFYEPPPAADTP
ncbi:MAG: hypothetical protein AB1601_00450 [Planctomycetota bacterium]